MTDYTRGQRVTFIAVHTARITATGNGHMNVQIESTQVADRPVIHWTHKGDDGRVYMALDYAMVKPVVPENWPPQIGDIWEADGTEYFVRRNTVDTDDLVIVPDYDEAQTLSTTTGSLISRLLTLFLSAVVASERTNDND